MTRVTRTFRLLIGMWLVGALSGMAMAQSAPVRLAGSDCERPPVLDCRGGDCGVQSIIAGGPVVEPETGRNYFLDYPCDLQPGEDVTLILSLHGGGSFGNWQRHYAPFIDYVDSNRLVVITPNAPRRFWLPEDDGYLRNIVSQIVDEIGAENISSFWLAGHSQGGMTSNRIVCSPFFRDRVDGWLSLSGGRIGGAPLAEGFGAPGTDPAAMEQMQRLFPPIEGVNGPEHGRPGTAVTPTCDFNYIFETGELEVGPLPDSSPWADKYGCEARARREDVVDENPGYVYDTSRQDPPNPSWGRAARPGTAEVFVYPNCEGGRLVAEVVRLDKGHTEGLEHNIMGALIDMMQAAPGSKIADHAAGEHHHLTLLGAEPVRPAVRHCPAADCPITLIGAPGNVTDPETGRQFYLDYPSDLEPGEDVTFVLNLHGGGSIANWQRHYFPLVDYVDEYRLVVATPSGTNFRWVPEEDDAYLHNIVTMVENAVGRENIRAFWLAGHSYGGQTSNRLIMEDPFFTERVDGWMSLSGGRLGSRREDVRAAIPRTVPLPPPPPDESGAPAMRLAAQAEILPERPFSFIYETGEHELTEAGLPDESAWAQQLGCNARAEPREIVDTRPGYVYDTREQERNPIWGTTPRPGTAVIYTYPNCDSGLYVADVVRMGKGHTEGLEPAITEELVRLMVSAPAVP